MGLGYLATDYVAQNPSWTYPDFKLRVWQIAHQLRSQNVNTVALWFEDGAKLACTLLACWHANVRTLCLPNLTQESVQWAEQYADLWLTDKSIEIEQAVVFDQFATEVQNVDQNRPLRAFYPHTELWLKTSGSTGKPKTIVKTAQQLWRNAEVCASVFGFPAGNDVSAVCTVSIQHLYGLICQIMLPLVLGWQIERKQQFFPENVAQACGSAKKSVLISSPTMLASIQWQRLAFPSLVGIVSAGGLLADQLSKAIQQQIGFAVTDFYGSTEAGAIAYRQGSTLWQSMPTAKIGVDERSALWIEADWLAGREQSEDVIALYATGFEILGRTDRMIKLGDKRLSLAGIEQSLRLNSLVSDCYIGQHPEKQRLACWLALNENGIEMFREQGRKAVIEALKAFLAQTQEKIGIPRFWRFTDTLPRNSQSKISYLAFESACLQKQREPIWQSETRVDNVHIWRGKVPIDLIYFRGHFSNFPLVPGVVELQWVMDKIPAFFGQEKIVQRIDNLKFQKFLRPNDEIELNLVWDKDKQRMKFLLKTADEPCASGLVIFSDE
ncbi:AMP-binding protein [Conservatibacter flavescens]|uniref:AMP-binding protein n=1 Tax=Conservatibacter flavescens TaxID=28161 RepID=A0A2M8S2N4_9PAST|nr:AMP-binding protein [Conservatibacter flavescens]PJG85409.1 AMP-binding protein [Conservatibacter flavescens]